MLRSGKNILPVSEGNATGKIMMAGTMIRRGGSAYFGRRCNHGCYQDLFMLIPYKEFCRSVGVIELPCAVVRICVESGACSILRFHHMSARQTGIVFLMRKAMENPKEQDRASTPTSTQRARSTDVKTLLAGSHFTGLSMRHDVHCDGHE